ncbi:hypothetical protein [Niallia nealsonii]|uniref:Uncharacterized protein n=1 Tax=Niallia nealsonii TaxID=115979 RepID=A0A2N0YWV4_9BACI|nr:hypothetical protein [Niallia nealsonii]PKG21733.1 hypothetical protein CWS01_20760 [Niallia nealsonii]
MRTEDHIPYYQLQDEEEGDPIQELLESILNQGKQTKEFGEFDNGLVKQIIIGAISERMFSSINEEIEFDSYFHELKRLILKWCNKNLEEKMNIQTNLGLTQIEKTVFFI